VAVTVGGTSTGATGSFTLAATNITVSQGGSGTSTVTVTSKNSYAGTVNFTVSTDSTSLNDYGCYDENDATVTANGTVTTTITLYTAGSSCGTSSSVAKGSRRHFAKSAHKSLAGNPGPRTATAPLHLSIAVAFGGFLLIGLRRRRFMCVTTLIWLATLGLSLVATGCGGSSSGSSTSNYVAKGTYTLTVDGTDTSDSSLTAETTFTLTVE
jgi:hypothetical protein